MVMLWIWLAIGLLSAYQAALSDYFLITFVVAGIEPSTSLMLGKFYTQSLSSFTLCVCVFL